MNVFRNLIKTILSWKTWSINKRTKIIASSIVLSLGLLSTQLVPFYLTDKFIAGLGLMGYFLTLWSLWEGISKIKGVTLMILPVLFTLAVSSYYFLLPVRWLTRLPVAFLFGLTFYTLLLSQNVFNVSAIRTIPLYRAASTWSFILTLITAFLLFNVIFSFELAFYLNFLVVFILCFLISIQVIWSINMETIDVIVITYSLIIALIIAQIAMALSLWPIFKPMASLVLSTGLFVTLGISTHALRERLSRGVVWEYIGWGLIIVLIASYTTSWVG